MLSYGRVDVGKWALAPPQTGRVVIRQLTIPTITVVNTADNSLNSRMICVAPSGGITNLFVGFPQFGFGRPEQPLPTGYTATCAVEYPIGTFTPFAFQLNSSTTVVPANGFNVSDVLSISIPAGATFYIKTHATWVAGNFWLAQLCASTLPSEWTAVGTGLSDNTQTATVLTSNSSGGFGPTVYTTVMGRKALGIIGDSIGFSGTDVHSPIDASNFMDRAMLDQIPAINLSMNGDGFGLYLNQPLGRLSLLLNKITHLICEFGTNDTFGSPTLAKLQSEAQQTWAPYLANGIRVWQTTLTPRTASTDGWATTGNQTIVSSGAELLMQQFNSWIRGNYASLGLSGYLDFRHAVDPTDSGLWNVDGVAGYSGGGFCTLTGGAVTACSLVQYISSANSGGTNFPASSTIPCVVYGYPGETGSLPTITANTNGSGVVTGFNIVSPGSGLLNPPMVAAQGSWTVDGTHPSHRGYNACISLTNLGPSLFT